MGYCDQEKAFMKINVQHVVPLREVATNDGWKCSAERPGHLPREGRALQSKKVRVQQSLLNGIMTILSKCIIDNAVQASLTLSNIVVHNDYVERTHKRRCGVQKMHVSRDLTLSCRAPGNYLTIYFQIRRSYVPFEREPVQVIVYT